MNWQYEGERKHTVGNSQAEQARQGKGVRTSQLIKIAVGTTS